MQVNLSRDSDFVAELSYDAGAMPDGSGVELRFDMPGLTPDVVWSATIDGDAIRWDVHRDDVAELLDGEPKGVKMHYVTDVDDNDLVWFKGAPRDFT